jgi:predicted Zn-dependent protease
MENAGVTSFNNIANEAEEFAKRLNAAMESTKLGDYFDDETTKDIGTYFNRLI